MFKSRFERKDLVSLDEEDEEKFSADETGMYTHSVLIKNILIRNTSEIFGIFKK